MIWFALRAGVAVYLMTRRRGRMSEIAALFLLPGPLRTAVKPAAIARWGLRWVRPRP